MMKKHSYKLTLLLSFLLISCNDFLEVEPLNKETTASFFSTEQGVYQALNGCYDILQERETYSTNMWAYGEIPTADFEKGGSGWNDKPEYNDLDQLTFNSAGSNFDKFYARMYWGIARCCLVTQKAPGAKFKDENLKKRYIAEARFVRALLFFDLFKVFGPIPVFSEPLLPNESLPRPTAKEVFNFLEKELKEMQVDLPWPSGYTAADNGRATKGAAKALLLKLYVFESSYHDINFYPDLGNRWAEAEAVADEIINSGEYALESNFKDLWPSFTGDNSKENIFKINTYPSSINPQEWSGPSIGMVHNTYFGCRLFFRKGSNTTSLLNVTDYWGFACPTQTLYNAFEPGDPRRQLTISTNNDSINRLTGSGTIERVRLNHFLSPTGMNTKKYTPEYEEYLGFKDQNASPRDVKLIRYADVLLMAAEAAYHNGNIGKATSLINQVRTRARNSGNTGVPVNLTEAELSLERIYQERRVELAVEGHRYFDLVRTGKAFEEIDGTVIKGPDPDFTVNFIKGKHELFPIPLAEIISSKGKVKQNPGY